MDPIKQAMDEAYAKGRFSQQKKEDTLMKAQKPRRSISFSFVVPAVVFCAMIGIVWALLQFQPNYETSQKHVMNSREPAPFDGVITMAERKLQFQQIIKDGEITELERVDYLRTSDWKLQLAFETHSSETYELPDNVDPEQLVIYAQLLFFMREYMYNEEVHQDVIDAFQQATKFEELPKLVSVLDAYVRSSYLSSADEDRPVSFYFETFSLGTKIIWLVAGLLIFGWAIWNMVHKRKIILFILQVLLMCVIIVTMTRPLEIYSAYDETSILQASEEIMRKYGSEFSEAKLLDSAMFDNRRYALIELQDSNDTKYALLTFQRQDDMYVFTQMEWMREDKTWVAQDWNRNEGQRIFLLALVEGHKAEKAEVTIYTNPPYNYELDIAPGTTLQAIYLPPIDKSMEIKLFDADGHIITE